jgi:hypothetical protein
MAIAGAAALAVYVAFVVGSANETVLLGCGLAVALLLAGLATGISPLVGWAAGILAVTYVGALVARNAPVDAATPLVAATLLVVVELGFWSLQCRTGSADQPAMHSRRAIAIALEAILAATIATICVLASTLSLGGGPASLVAIAVLLLLFALIGALAWRVRHG